MAKPPSLFEQYGSDTDLTVWDERIKGGELPTREQLKAILFANQKQALTGWLLDIVVLGIDGKLKGTRGRRGETPLAEQRWVVAREMYKRMLPWLQRREKGCGLRGWKMVRNQHWWNGPPHERAARIVIARFSLGTDVRAFLNRISSDKTGGFL